MLEAHARPAGRGFLVALVALLLSVAGVFFVVRMLFHGELADKPIYAALQAAELEHRGAAEADVVDETLGGVSLAGLQTGAGERVWIALEVVKDDGTLYAIPDESRTSIPCRLVDQLAVRGTIAQEVEKALRGSCVRPD